MSISSTRTKLLELLNTVADIPTVYKEGENFRVKSTNDYPFCRFAIMPNTSSRGPLTSGESQQMGATLKKFYAGLARIDVYYNRSANSATDALILAEAIVTAFLPSTITLSDSQLNIEASWFEEIRQEDSAIGVPVFIRWSNYSL